VLDNPFGEEIFPNIQCKPPLTKLKAVSSYHLLLGRREQHPPCYNLLSGSCRENKVSPQPPLLQTKQPQFPQPPHRTCSLDPSPALLLFFGHTPATDMGDSSATGHVKRNTTNKG